MFFAAARISREKGFFGIFDALGGFYDADQAFTLDFIGGFREPLP